MSFDFKKIFQREEESSTDDLRPSGPAAASSDEEQEVYYIEGANAASAVMEEDLQLQEQNPQRQAQEEDASDEYETPSPLISASPLNNRRQQQKTTQQATATTPLPPQKIIEEDSSSIVNFTSRFQEEGEVCQEEKSLKKAFRKQHLFDTICHIDDLNLPSSVIKDLILKTIFAEGHISAKELSQRTHLPLHTVLEPLLLDLVEYEFIVTVFQRRGGGKTQEENYKLTDSGSGRAMQAMNVSNYVGPAPVSLSDYLQAIAQYPPLKIPPPKEFKELYKDFFLPNQALEKLAVSISAGKSILLSNRFGHDTTALFEKIKQFNLDSIKVPYAVCIDGVTIKMFDPLIHSVKLNSSQSSQTKEDARWFSCQRPLINLDDSSLDNPQYNISNGSNYFFSASCKANGGILLVNTEASKDTSQNKDVLQNGEAKYLLSEYHILSLQSGSRYQIPNKHLTVFLTDESIKDNFSSSQLSPITHKIELPAISLEDYCQAFVDESEDKGVKWKDEVLEYLIQNCYKGQSAKFRADHPKHLIARVIDICQYYGKRSNYELTKEILDKAWNLYFLNQD